MGLFDKFKKQEVAPQTTLVPNVGRMPYPAYRGREPFIFISYAHLDYEKVFAEIKAFNEYGYNVWYDEGISPGNEWTDEIANALEKCSLFVVFITPNSAVSKNVLKEINFAIEDGKALVAIHLEKTALSGGMKLQISSVQAIMKYTMSQEEYVYKYTTAFTRLGMHSKVKVQTAAPSQPYSAAPTAPAASFQVPPPDNSPGQFQREITRVGDFIVEHGHLHEYLGTEKNIKLPDIVQIVGSLGQGSKYVETVDLNKAGAIFDGAFSDCPNLREIRIPKTVTMIQKFPFSKCPQLTLYCYRDQLPKGFEEYFGGKEIVYLDNEPASTPIPPADNTPKQSDREFTRVGEFLVEHGLLHAYLGTEKNIKLPDAVGIVGSLGLGSKYVETVDLNKASALFDGAFTDCPNLREIRLTKAVTMIQKFPFMNCPQLTLYCYRDQLPKGFEEYFGGKEIVYLDEVPDPAPVASPDDRVVFKSPEMHRIVCAELGLSEDTVLTKTQCNQVTSIMVCGDAIGRKFNAYTNDGTNVKVLPIYGTSDTVLTVGRGSLDTLEDIPLLKNLSKLIIPYQSISDVSPLAGTKIEKLDLSANIIDNTSALASMRFLKELQISNSKPDSLKDLGKSRSLGQLVFGGIRQVEFDELCENENESLSNIIVSSSSGLRNIDKVGNLKNLERLYIGQTGVTNLEPLTSLKYLQRLGIQNLLITDYSVIKRLPNLKALATVKAQEEAIAELYGGTFPFTAY